MVEIDSDLCDKSVATVEIHFSKIKRKNGITLIALVITIILFLILAGITISQLTEVGLFKKAEKAKKKSDNVQEIENITLADYESKIDKYIDGNRDYIQDDILWEGLIGNVGQTAILERSIENYKYLLLETCYGSQGTTTYDTWVNVDTIKKIGYNASFWHTIICMFADHYITIGFANETSLAISAQNANVVYLTKVIGIK